MSHTTVYRSGKDYVGVNLVCGQAKSLESCINIRDVHTGERISIPDEGVVIQRRMAESDGLSVGDTITIYDQKWNSYDAVISAIYENYFGKDMLISEKAYQNLTGSKPNMNTILVKNIEDTEALEMALSKSNYFYIIGRIPHLTCGSDVDECRQSF